MLILEKKKNLKLINTVSALKTRKKKVKSKASRRETINISAEIDETLNRKPI